MKFLSFVTGLAVLSGTVFGHTIQDGSLEERGLERRAVLPVTGAPGGVKIRYEIRQLAQRPNEWNIFLLAMQQYQAKAQTQKTSYYQIAGIHGVPNIDFDGVGKCSNCGNPDGYCTHQSILFPAWHRAYLALFEQELVAIAKNIANKYPQNKRAAMQAAANNMRLPYWDWAAHPPNNGPNIPASVTNAYVTVNSPTGNKQIRNPLFRHDFRNSANLKYTPFINWDITYRYPTSNAANAVSDTSKLISAFDNIRASLQDQIYQMFSTCDEYVEVASDAKGQSSLKCSNSLENIHNTIHNTAGGLKHDGISGGHMTYLAEAAFDPIFWLHHANVDRLFALWQGKWPNSYGGSQVAPHNTWTIAQGTTQNANSPLTPFHRDSSGNFWTTNLVRDWTKFGYTYPEFADSNGSKKAIASYINKLYGPSATATAGSSKRTAAPEPVTSSASSTASAASSSASSASAAATTDLGSLITPLVANNGSLFQYVANIETSRFALGGSYNIYLFNGAPTSEEPSDWVVDSNLIGPMGVLAQPGMESDTIAVGSIPLTRTLTDQVQGGLLGALTQLLVVPYLATHLQWRVAGPDGEKVDPDSIPNFKISVYSSTATPAEEFELPMWSEFIPLADVTKNKAGGATAQTIDGILGGLLGGDV